jgi:hypothetical protein
VLAGVQGGAGEPSGGEHRGAGTVVEVGDIVAAQRDHDRAGQVVLRGGPPVVDQRGPDLFGGGGSVDPAVLAVGGESSVDLAVAELVERDLFPHVLLPPVVGQFDRGEPGGQGAEQAAGVDLGQLVGVADEHDLHGLRFGVVEEAGELAGADHPGLVDHEHRPGLERRPVAVVVEAGEQPRQGGGADPGGGFELERGAGSQGDPGDRIPDASQASRAASSA